MGEMKLCPHCGAKMVEYPHNLNNGMVSALYRLWKAKKPENLQELGLTHNQYNNFYKLRYWGLANSTKTEGKWLVTERGRDFLEGKIAVQTKVWTYRKKPLRFEGDAKYIYQFDNPEYQKREDYIDNAVSHEGEEYEGSH